MDYTKEMARELNRLLEKNYDAEKGYKDAADKVEHPKMKQFLEDQAKMRNGFGHEIKKEIKNYGETPDKGGSATGTLHRAWTDLKAAVSSDKAEQVMEEVQRGEKDAIHDYNTVILSKDLPPATKIILEGQRDKIKQAAQSAANFEKIS